MKKKQTKTVDAQIEQEDSHKRDEISSKKFNWSNIIFYIAVGVWFLGVMAYMYYTSK